MSHSFLLTLISWILLRALIWGCAGVSIASMEEEWNAFKVKYSKYYSSPSEDETRKLQFFRNQLEIAEHNKRYARGEVTYRRVINKFADMLPQDIKHTVAPRFILPSQRNYHCPESIASRMPNTSILPDVVDWRNKGAVTPVKTQGSCVATWAFSATGAVESHHFIKTGQLVDLSEQNLIDCSQDFGNLGCEGGRADQAFEYIIQNKGIDLEELYPYASKTMPCAFDKGAVGATISGFRTVPQSSEEQLQAVVATVGPVAVAVDATHDDFFQYDQGIYTNPFCSTSDVNYGLLIVGYGTVNGIDYWICKNSMGPDWGEHGYIRMARNKGNQCGIATLATYPEV
nr:procathepsin L-like isoform X1 [Dermacentor andersoni]